MHSTPLTADERYSRQILLRQLGPDGQKLLSRSKVLCIGAGGLGSPALLYLAAAGVGKIGIVDDDVVSLSNLQRQILFTQDDLGKNKAERAKFRLNLLNPELEIECFSSRFDASCAEELVSRYSVVIDGSDNFPTKFLANDVCVKLGIPLVYGSILQFEGHLSTFDASKGPCYRCLFPRPPETAVPNCAEVGVLGAVAGVIGATQALEAIKCALQNPELPPLSGKLAVFDGIAMSWSSFMLPKNPACPICSMPRSQIRLEDTALACGLPEDDCSAQELSALLEAPSPPALIDLREAAELAIGAIPGARHWPFSRLQSGLLPPLPASGAAILYCASGVRSKAALQILRSKGVKRLRHLVGGFSSWAARRDRLPPGQS